MAKSKGSAAPAAPVPKASAPAAGVKPPLVHLSTSAPTQQADDFLRDRGEDTYAMRGLGVSRDMTPVERMRAVRLSRVNYKRSGIYGQLIDTLANFVVGDGIAVKCKSEATQKYVEKVLQHPLNSWDRSLRARFITTAQDGEYLLSITIPQRGGVTELGAPTLSSLPLIGRMSTDDIEDVHLAAVNQDQILGVTVDLGAGKDKVTFPVARPGTMPRDNGDGTSTAVLLWQMNRLGRRGLPFFSRTLDKAHRLDGVVDELARKADYTSRFWLHGTYEDQGSKSKNKAVEKRLLAWLRSMRPGEALASTKGIEVNVFAPSLNLPDQKALYDLIVDYILGSHGVPRMWFSSGDGTNRATGVEQGTPIFRSVDAAQSGFVTDIRDLVAYVIWIGKQSGALGASESDEFEISPSDVATRDSLRDVKEANDLTLALDAAVASGILSPLERQKIGRRVFASKGWGGELEEKPPPLPQAAPAAPPTGAVPGHRMEAGDGTGDPALPGDGTGQGAAGANPAGPRPVAPAVGGPAGGGTVQDTAMNGAQVTALTGIVQAVADGTLPAAAAKPLILGAFPMFPEAYVDTMIAAADKFEPPKPEPQPGAGAPPAPGAPPPPPKKEGDAAA